MLNDEQKNLVLKHLHDAGHVARKHTFSLTELDDHIQEAALGLIEAAASFDPSMDTNFRPFGWRRSLWRITKYSKETIANHRCIPARGKQAKEYDKHPVALSFYAREQEDGMSLEEVVSSGQDIEAEVELAQRTDEMMEVIQDLLSKRDDREKMCDIIQAVIDPDYHMSDVAVKYNITRQAIQQTKARFFKEVRERLDARY